MKLFMRFPKGLAKALTLSYDDGVESDVRLVEIMKKHGLRGTFNLNSGIVAPEGTVYPAGTIHRRMSRSGLISAFADSGMEVAVHAYTHPYLEQLPSSLCAYEIVRDRETLEEMFGGVIRGMAYPYGTYDEKVIGVLEACGIAYSRTVKATGDFRLPTRPLAWDPTCHHNDPKLMQYAERLVNGKPTPQPRLFYLWGHSYEFDRDDNWELIEKFAEYIGGHDDIWYATNIEIIDYMEAYGRLKFSMNGKRIYNPSSIELWFSKGADAYSVAPGETIEL